MEGLAFLLKNILALVFVAFGFLSLYWLGILPAIALQVLLNTLYMGLALFIFVDILLNTRRQEEH